MPAKRSGGRRRRRRRLRPWRLLAALFATAGLAAYALVWLLPPLHAAVTETLIVSRHSWLDRLFTTPGEFALLRRDWFDTPNVLVITPITSAAGGLGSGNPARDGLPATGPGITLERVSGPDYSGFLLLIANPAWVHVGVSNQLGLVGEQTANIGHDYAAVAAVNGGGFEDAGGMGNGGIPVGLTASYGSLVSLPDLTGDYVIGFDTQNRLVVGKFDLAQARILGIRDAVSFKPLLVSAGRPMITQGDGGWGIGPRTALGQRADGTVIFAVIDGRQPASLGATLLQLQAVMLQAGAVTAVNLDGGSSTTLWYQGQVLNHPCCSPNGQRYIPTAFVVTPGRTAAPPLDVRTQG